jgi:hypothetical protein
MYGSTEHRPSQRARVYAELRQWYPRECPLWTLHDLKPRISDLTTRLWELRHNYHAGIGNRIERDSEGVRSFYLLVRDSRDAANAFGYGNVLPALDKPARSQSLTESKTVTKPLPQHGSLFGDLSPGPGYPD